MIHNNHSDILNLTRTVGTITEGTPSFEDDVKFTGDLSTSKFTLRFHFLSKTGADHQAIGWYDGTC